MHDTEREGGPRPKPGALARVSVRFAEAGWFTAPFTAVIVGQGALRFRIADLLLGAALAGAVLVYRPQVQRRTLRLLVGIGLIGGGVLTGTAVGGAGGAVQLAGFVVAAAVPALLTTWLRPSGEQVRRFARLFLAGTCLSVAAGLAGQRTSLGAAIGFAAHRNQLGMTIAISLPLIGLFPRQWRLPLWGFLLLGLNETGSRSAILGAAVSAGLLLLAWIRRRPYRTMPLILAGMAGVLLAILTIGDGVTGDTALARLAGTESSEQSDEERDGLLTTGLRELDLGTALTGAGYFLDPPPHNVFLETWIAGGILAFTGLGMVMAGALRPLWGLRHRMVWPPSDRYRFSCGVAGWAAVVMLNNLLWAPFVWAMVALVAYSPSSPPEGPGTRIQRSRPRRSSLDRV